MEICRIDTKIANVLASGSTGNCVIYHEFIMVDIGVPFSTIRPYLYDIKVVVLTHKHQDHFNLPTLKRLCYERPTVRIFCGEWMVPLLDGIKNVDVGEIGNVYNYGLFKISPVKAYHDVPNMGVRIFKGDHKLIHITDTFTLEGITAKNYDIFCIEHNYNEETVYDKIKEKEAAGEYAHQRGAINSHLSEQQARDFIYKNGAAHSQVVRLHESESSY